MHVIWLFKHFISEQSKCLVILKLLVLRQFQFCPKVALKYLLHILHLCVAYSIIAPLSGKSIFICKKRESAKLLTLHREGPVPFTGSACFNQ